MIPQWFEYLVYACAAVIPLTAGFVITTHVLIPLFETRFEQMRYWVRWWER